MHPTITIELARLRADEIARGARRHRLEIAPRRRGRRFRVPELVRTLHAQLSHV